MQAQDLLDIEASISTPRLRSYAQLTGNPHDKAQLIGAYQWNKRVSSALYPILQCLEISLRNAIHNAATAHFATSDWFDRVTKVAGNEMFLSDMKKNHQKQGKFYRKGVSKGSKKGLKTWFSYHENMLKNAKNKLSKEGKKQTPDSIIAELTFGFWVGLFESPYNDIQTKDRLWPHLEKVVFPELPPSERVHSKIYSKLDPIKDMRNRLSHHEPVWKDHKVNDSKSAISYLNNTIDDILLLIAGISPSRYKLLINSGKVSYFRGICSNDTINYYLTGNYAEKIDKRRLKRNIERSIKKPMTNPLIVMDKSYPKLVVDLWLP